MNFGLIYGMSAFGLAQQLGIERGAAQQFIDKYFQRYPGVAEYMQRTRELAREQGYVETVFGRRLWLPDIKAGGGPRRAGAERAAINAPMQGTAADLIKLAMIAVQRLDRRASGSPRKLVLQVHDELVLEVPDAELARVQRELPGADDGRRGAIGAAGRRCRRRPELGTRRTDVEHALLWPHKLGESCRANAGSSAGFTPSPACLYSSRRSSRTRWARP